VAKTDFSWVNAGDTATYMAGSEASTLPSANLATFRSGRVWRALTTSTYFTATFAAATSINVLALGGCTLTATDTVRHRLYAGVNGTGALLLDTGAIACGVLAGYGMHVYKLAAALTPLSWRCDIVATSRGVQGYFDVARAWAGPVLQPGVGIDHGWDEAWLDGANNVRGSLSGALFPGDGPQYRVLNANLGWLSDAEKAQFKEMQRIVGTRSQVLFIPDEDGDVPREAILGHLGPLQQAKEANARVPPVYSQAFTITQDL
jgi:hypothetical protein